MNELTKRHPAARGLLMGACAALVIALVAILLVTENPTAAAEVPALRPGDHDALTGAATKASNLELNHPPSDTVERNAIPAPTDSVPQGRAPVAPSNSDGETIVAMSGRFAERLGTTVKDSTFDGTVRLLVSAHGDRQSVDVPVKEGRFELRLRRLSEHRFSTGKEPDFYGRPEDFLIGVGAPRSVAGKAWRPTAPPSPSTQPSPREIRFGALDVVVYLEPAQRIELAVKDAETKLPLRGIQVFFAEQYNSRRLDAAHWKNKLLASSDTSPISVHSTGRLASSKATRIRVIADGYAPTFATVNFTKSHRRAVELVAAGSLHVSFEGTCPPESSFCIAGAGAPILFDQPATGADVVVDGLAPGTYTAKVQIGSIYARPVVLASSPIEIEQGEMRRLTLVVDPLVPPARVHMAGQIHIPQEWELLAPTLDLRFLSPTASTKRERWKADVASGGLTPMPGQPGKFAFNFPDMSIGEYELKLRNMAYIEHVQLPPEGLSNFVMAVPPPINVTVRVEDVETGQDIPSVTEVVWTPNRPDGSLRLGGVPVERDAITGTFQLRITDCELTLWAKAPDYSQEMRSFRPTSGQVAVLRLRPRLSVELELRDGGVVIPWPKGDHTWVESASKGEEWCPNGKRDGIRWFMVNHPGKYSLEIPKIDGYQAHAPVEFTVEKGAKTSVIIDLTPE